MVDGIGWLEASSCWKMGGMFSIPKCQVYYRISHINQGSDILWTKSICWDFLSSNLGEFTWIVPCSPSRFLQMTQMFDLIYLYIKKYEIMILVISHR